MRIDTCKFNISPPEAFSEALSNQKILDLQALIIVVADPTLGVNGMRSARLKVDVDSQTHRSFVDRVLGDPDMPMSHGDVTAKYPAICHSEPG